MIKEFRKKTPDEPQKNPKNKKKPAKKKAIRIIAAVLTVLTLAIGITYISGGFEAIDYYLFYRHRVIDAGVMSDGSFPVTFSSDDIISTENISSKMIVLSKKLLTCISYKGRVLYTEAFTFVEPQMNVNDKYGVLFDRGSSKYIIFDAYGIVYEGTTEGNRHIITATVDNKGNCAIATKSDDSACRVYMVDKSGEIKYIWSCAEEYAVCLDISKNSDEILCGTLGAYNNEVYTKVYCLDVYSDGSSSEYQISDSPCVNVSFNGKNNAVIDCVDKRVILDLRTSDGSPVEVNFSGDTVHMDWDKEGNLAVVTDRINSIGVNEITLYDKNNSVIFRSEVPENTLDILCAGDKVYCLTEESVVTYGNDGSKLSTYLCDVIGDGLVRVKGKIYYHTSGSIKKGF